MRVLKEYTKSTEIPEALQLTGGEYRQLFDVVREDNGKADGIFNALTLAYHAGFEAARHNRLI